MKRKNVFLQFAENKREQNKSLNLVLKIIKAALAFTCDDDDIYIYI